MQLNDYHSSGCKDVQLNDYHPLCLIPPAFYYLTCSSSLYITLIVIHYIAFGYTDVYILRLRQLYDLKCNCIIMVINVNVYVLAKGKHSANIHAYIVYIHIILWLKKKVRKSPCANGGN